MWVLRGVPTPRPTARTYLFGSLMLNTLTTAMMTMMALVRDLGLRVTPQNTFNSPFLHLTLFENLTFQSHYYIFLIQFKYESQLYIFHYFYKFCQL